MVLIKKWCMNKKFNRLTRGDKIEHNEQYEKSIDSRVTNKGQNDW